MTNELVWFRRNSLLIVTTRTTDLFWNHRRIVESWGRRPHFACTLLGSVRRSLSRNTYWTEAAAYREGLELDYIVFGNRWTKYWGALTWFDCDPELPCECEEHHCLRTHSMEGHVPAAAATAKPELVPLIVVEPPTPTPSEIDAYDWHW